MADTTPPPAGLHLVDAALDDLSVARVYELLALRTEVFVVEQACAYAELDGRDLEPGARHVFLVDDDNDRVASYLRCLRDHDGTTTVTRIGRVVTHPDHRGRGLAAWLLEHVVAGLDGVAILDAQSHLAEFYRRIGFLVAGPGWTEDGIPHVPMRLERSDG